MSHPTPTTPEGVRQYDHLPASEAVRRAWLAPGRDPRWHADKQDEVRYAMPLLARALGRLARDGAA